MRTICGETWDINKGKVWHNDIVSCVVKYVSIKFHIGEIDRPVTFLHVDISFVEKYLLTAVLTHGACASLSWWLCIKSVEVYKSVEGGVDQGYLCLGTFSHDDTAWYLVTHIYSVGNLYLASCILYTDMSWKVCLKNMQNVNLIRKREYYHEAKKIRHNVRLRLPHVNRRTSRPVCITCTTLEP